ncbi:MAG: DUF72 domain-containing protein [Candidatus Omnitrophota bacterium]
MKLKIGCCGFPVGRQKYYEKFKLVEIQRTFYRLPRIETAEKWRLFAPDNFEFTLKAWQLITHESTSPTYRRLSFKMKPGQKKKCGSFKPTDEVFRAWEETEKIASVLKSRIIVFQCPASFRPTKENKENLRKFFRTIRRKRYKFAWEPRGDWTEKDIKRLCEDLDLIHCVDPFQSKPLYGNIRYFRLHGIGAYRYKYKGWELKQLQEFCESESILVKRKPIYVLFNNTHMFEDAARFEWIAKNTGLIRSLNLNFLERLCREIDAKEEEEKVQILSREAEKIVSLILHTDYAKVDIEIEKEKLRELCEKLFPEKGYLYDMIYSRRFDRLWEQFRGKK